MYVFVSEHRLAEHTETFTLPGGRRLNEGHLSSICSFGGLFGPFGLLGKGPMACENVQQTESD